MTVPNRTASVELYQVAEGYLLTPRATNPHGFLVASGVVETLPATATPVNLATTALRLLDQSSELKSNDDFATASGSLPVHLSRALGLGDDLSVLVKTARLVTVDRRGRRVYVSAMRNLHKKKMAFSGLKPVEEAEGPLSADALAGLLEKQLSRAE